jgi:hypothetical protein
MAHFANEAFDFHSDESNYTSLCTKPSRCGEVFISGRRISVTPVFFAYWRFAVERQNIFFRRLTSSGAHRLTDDPVLAAFKFTNVYRASDRVSQYLIRNVIYRSDLPSSHEEVFFRTILFKLFNKIETWEALEAAVGEVTLSSYRYKDYNDVLSRRMGGGERIYSAAYIMPSGRSAFGRDAKHQNNLLLLEYMIAEGFPERLAACASMDDAYALMLSAPSIGPFLAYQYVTDLNYGELLSFDESDFVVAGPGALDGIAKCFVGANDIPASEIITYMFENQANHFAEQGLNFQSLWGRPLQLIDCQNVFCEISKYARAAFPDVAGVSGRTRIKQKFNSRKPLPEPWYPPKWGINDRIEANYPLPTVMSEIATAEQLTMF